MTYKKLYEDALFKLELNKITLGEFEEMTKPLDREVEQEPTEKIHSKTCGTCKYFKKLGGHCTHWGYTQEVELPITEHDYCSRHREVEG